MTRPFRASLVFFVLLMGVYTLLRLGFYLSNLAFFDGVPASDIAAAFVHGLRFDASALLLINAPLLVLFLLPGDPSRWRWFRRALFALFCAVNILGIALNIADFEYYATIQRRLLYEPYTMMPDLARMAPSLLVKHTLPVLLFAVVSGLVVLLLARTARAVWSRGAAKRGWLRESGFFVLAVLLLVLGIRGGVQLKPIRQANAFFTARASVGYLVLNSTYTVTRSLFQPMLPEYSFRPPETVRRELDEMLRREDERFLRPDYDFLRAAAPVDSARRLNVVVLIMESWTSVYSGCITGKRSATPFFDSLAADGLLFTNFIASGQRSIEAVPAILASVPALWPASLIGSQAELDRFRGLGDILREQGYATSFHHGAATGSMGFDAFSRLAGFQRYFGKEDYPDAADSLMDGVWGLNDEPFFLDAAEKIGALGQPFCSVLFSLSSHDPFELPRHRRPLFEGFAEDSEFEQSLRYSDFAVSQFFRAARRAPWFANTVFIITGDHTLFGARNSFHSSFHVPMLLYAPGIVAPGRDARMGSHCDILPTVLDLLRLRTSHASMGASLLRPGTPRYAVVRYGPQFGIFSDSLVLVHDLENTVGLYNPHRDPQFTRDLQHREPALAEDLRTKLLCYIQAATSAIRRDRIYTEKKGE
ncbi:MAG: sulfatase-like hydrolase/transferase [Ignavibacteria bacterium]|nr:sulfatase-like hydrolase/transferase [Ignavibacteria bacterium]